MITGNPFDLYIHPDKSETSKEATTEMANLIDNFMQELEKVQEKYRAIGFFDTASREATAVYIAKEKLKLIRLD